MPADITGTEILQETDGQRQMTFVKGPIFANMILADEINRTPPKTQAAMLEAMQEHHVTAAGVGYELHEPFFVFATQNPIEMEGTYPLPEAQLDRFMFNVSIGYLSEDDEVAVVRQTTTTEPQPVTQVFSGADLLRFHAVVRRVPIAEDVVRYAVRLAAASRPSADNPLAFHQRVGHLGRRPAGLAVHGARGQGPRAALRAGACQLRRHPGSGPPGAAASHPDQLPGRGRGRDRRQHRGPPAEIGEGLEMTDSFVMPETAAA